MLTESSEDEKNPYVYVFAALVYNTLNRRYGNRLIPSRPKDV